MSHAKRTGHTRWQVPLPPGITRLQAAHGSVFGSGSSGAVHAWSTVDGSLRFSRGEQGTICEGFAVVNDSLLVVLAKRKHAEVFQKTAFSFDANTGLEHGRTELSLDGPVGGTSVAHTHTHLFLSLQKSAELLGLDDQAQEVVLLALEPGVAVANLLGAGDMVVAMVTPHQGLRGYLADETLALSLDNAMPLAWSDSGLLAMVNGEVRCLDERGVERWRRPFDVSSRMVLTPELVIAVDHLGMVHALDTKSGETKWSTSSSAKKSALLNPVVCDGHAWVLNALGQVVAFDLTDGRKAFAPNDHYPQSRGLIASEHSVFIHREVAGHDTLTALEFAQTR